MQEIEFPTRIADSSGSLTVKLIVEDYLRAPGLSAIYKQRRKRRGIFFHEVDECSTI